MSDCPYCGKPAVRPSLKAANYGDASPPHNIQFNEQHLGLLAASIHAKDVVRTMRPRGWQIEYHATADTSVWRFDNYHLYTLFCDELAEVTQPLYTGLRARTLIGDIGSEAVREVHAPAEYPLEKLADHYIQLNERHISPLGTPAHAKEIVRELYGRTWNIYYHADADTSVWRFQSHMQYAEFFDDLVDEMSPLFLYLGARTIIGEKPAAGFVGREVSQ